MDFYSNHIYSKMNDNELVHAAQQGDVLATEFILEKYHYFIKLRTRSYYIKGAETEDVFQEAMLGFYKAVRDFDEKADCTFRSFADLCIKRQLITAVKTATRNKHMVHLRSLSFHKPINDEESITLLEIVANQQTLLPEIEMLSSENKEELKNALSTVLSELEFQSLLMYSNGYSYREVAKKLGRNYKSVDAAINRAKQKLRKYFMSEGKALSYIKI